jgi:hypothetical protein
MSPSYLQSVGNPLRGFTFTDPQPLSQRDASFLLLSLYISFREGGKPFVNSKS